MTRKINRRKGTITTYTTCGELLAAVLQGAPDRRTALAQFEPDSPLQRRLKQQILLVR